VSGLECELSEKRNRICELEEQVKGATSAASSQEDLAAQLQRQIENLTQERVSGSNDREDRR
jgi:uncharacterized protein YigA (DUF484 family)